MDNQHASLLEQASKEESPAPGTRARGRQSVFTQEVMEATYDLRKKMWTWKAIHAWLAERGIDISTKEGLRQGYLIRRHMLSPDKRED